MSSPTNVFGERQSPNDQGVIHGCKGGSQQWANPEDPVIIPRLVSVPDNSGSKTTSWVDACACDGDGSQVDQENCESDGKRRQQRNMRVASISFGVSGREHGVHQHKGAHNLSAQPVAFGVAMGHNVRTPARSLVEYRLKAFHDARPTNSAQALAHHVQQKPWKRHLPCQKQSECHCRINVTP